MLSCGMTRNEDLALADQHIVQTEGRVTQQLQRIVDMTAAGQDTGSARDVLLALEWRLLTAQRHRQLLLAEPPA